MALNQTSTPWAKADDWDEHREIITELYINRRRKVEDLTQIMAAKYGFHATQRMYKTRFKKWGLTKKKPKPAGVEGAPSVTGTSGQPISPTGSVQQIMYHRFVHTLQRFQNQSTIRSMAPPDCYRFAEGTFHFTQAYLNSIGFPILGSPISDKSLVTAAAGAEWLNCVTTAKTLLTFGHLRGAVMLIDVCCHQYRSLLISQDLSLMAITILAVLRVLDDWPGLAKAFLDFVLTMSQIVLGTSHPLSMLFRKFKEVGVDHLAYCFGASLQHFLGGIIHIMPHPMMESYGNIYYDMFHYMIMDTSVALSELRHLQHRLRQRLQGRPYSDTNSVEDTATIQSRIAWLHFYARRYEDATKLTLEMLGEPIVDPRVTAGCYDFLYDVAVAENKHDLALDMIKKAVEFSTEAYGYAHCTTTRKMVRLESCLRSMSRLSEADKVRSEWEMQLTEMCEKTRRLSL